MPRFSGSGNGSGGNISSTTATSPSTGKTIKLVFIATCLVTVILQVLGSIMTWNQDIPHRYFGYVDYDNRYGGGRRVLRSDSYYNNNNNNNNNGIDVNNRHQQLASIPQRHQPQQQLPHQQQQQHSGRLRVLFGILTADFQNDRTYRKRHRALFALWDDPRVCSLDEFKSRPRSERYQCQLIYTFVMGGNPDAAPELVDQSRPMLVQRPIVLLPDDNDNDNKNDLAPDTNNPDTTLLNIRENMNEGKSQTWLKYAAELAAEYDIDYVAKCDADTSLHLHEFFRFAYKSLPPAPYNRNVYVGALRDKAFWPKHATDEDRAQHESYFGNNYEGVHLYIAGQIYIMSQDLARFVGEEALRSNCSYCEGHEDHDVSAMAFHSSQPVHLVAVGRSHRFWEHPVKGEPRWKRIWARETARVNGKPFEGKYFTTNSTIEAVLG